MILSKGFINEGESPKLGNSSAPLDPDSVSRLKLLLHWFKVQTKRSFDIQPLMLKELNQNEPALIRSSSKSLTTIKTPNPTLLIWTKRRPGFELAVCCRSLNVNDLISVRRCRSGRTWICQSMKASDIRGDLWESETTLTIIYRISNVTVKVLLKNTVDCCDAASVRLQNWCGLSSPASCSSTRSDTPVVWN